MRKYGNLKSYILYSKFMSHIGKRKIIIPDNVDVKIDNDSLMIKGPRGELNLPVSPQLDIKLDGKELSLYCKVADSNKAIWGLTNALLVNAIKGVVDGFSRQLEMQGVGYRANIQGGKLVLSLGFSHLIEIEAPLGVTFSVEKNIITVFGFNKQLVGEIAAKIRELKKPESYKGKGIRYVGEYVRLKAGKKTVGAGF